MITPYSTRRSFLVRSVQSASTLACLPHFAPVSAEEAQLDPQHVRFGPEIEPLVRLLEDTPRGALLEEVATRVRQGLSYREVLAGLLLAGVRNVQPRPSVGFKFHAVLVVNSAHLASLSSPAADRWLPIFWALDYFKSAQARDVNEGDWTMASVDEANVPSAGRAHAALVRALERWDVAAADTAVTGLVRTAGAYQVFELLFRYAARDFRSIGHKAIFAANSWRTLQCIGWQHAEPVVRSLVYAMLNHHGEPNPAESDLDADRPWRLNSMRASQIPESWQSGKVSDEATVALLQVLRSGTSEQVCDAGVDWLKRGAAPQSLWDALFAAAGEMVMRQPGIIALHAVTTTNALHFAYQTSGNDETRRLLLLQNLAFLPLFRQRMPGRGPVGTARIDQLEPLAPAGATAGLEAVFAAVRSNRDEAAQRALGYLEQSSQAEPLIDMARQYVFLKGDDSHDYKFSSAALEDYYHVSPAWRNRFLAATTYQLRGAGERENPLVQRIRTALS